jgi:hypothetical protein
MGRIERSRFAAEEALGEIGGVPQVEVSDLRALDADNAEEMPGWDVECGPSRGGTMVTPIFAMPSRALS